MKVLGTGLSGLVGVRLTQLLSDGFEFTNLSLDTGKDITDRKSVEPIYNKSDAPWIFHLAAYTDVDKAELDRKNGTAGQVWKLNVEATRTIVDSCRQTGKKLLFISTDYVFDGKKAGYDETDRPVPESWYGISKYEAEQQVLTLGRDALIVRIANPYRSSWPGKPDFFHKILDFLGSGQKITAPSDQIFVPTYIDDIATAIRFLINKSKSGVFHAVGSQALSPYQAAVDIAKAYGYPAAQVTNTDFKTYFQNRAPRPFLGLLKNDKISGLGIKMSTFTEGISKVRQQEKGIKE